jgi:hypothetical protein
MVHYPDLFSVEGMETVTAFTQYTSNSIKHTYSCLFIIGTCWVQVGIFSLNLYNAAFK